MRCPPDRRWPRVVVNLVFAGLVVVAALPVYLFVDVPWRSSVARLAAALVLGVLLRQVHKGIVALVQRDEASAFDAACSVTVAELRVDRGLVDLVVVVKAARRSRRAFEHWLWPRLSTLTRVPMPMPKPRRFRRGPSLDELRVVVQTMEDRA